MSWEHFSSSSLSSSSLSSSSSFYSFSSSSVSLIFSLLVFLFSSKEVVIIFSKAMFDAWVMRYINLSLGKYVRSPLFCILQRKKNHTARFGSRHIKRDISLSKYYSRLKICWEYCEHVRKIYLVYSCLGLKDNNKREEGLSLCLAVT